MDANERQAIARLCHRLLAEHLNREPEEIAALVAKEDSLLAVVARCAGTARCLEAIDLSGASSDALSPPVGQIADPERPIETPEFVGDMFGGRQATQPGSHVWTPAVLAAMSLSLIPPLAFPPL